MKECFLCAALLCLILAACTAVTNQPTTTTAPQPTTGGTTGSVPPCYQAGGQHHYVNEVCIICGTPRGRPTTAPITSSTVTTAAPTTGKPTTTVTTTQPTSSSVSAPIDPNVAHGVRVVSGNQMIVPEEEYRGGKFKNGDRWLYPSGMGIVWYLMDLRETPIITFDDSLTIVGKPNGVISVKEIDGDDFEDIEVSLVYTLPSGIYMVEFGITYYHGGDVSGESGFNAYEYGFLLVIPGPGADKPLPDPCAGGHKYYFGRCDICGSADPDYKQWDCSTDGHAFLNGQCRYCQAQHPYYTMVTTKPTTGPIIYTDYKCYFTGQHEYTNGRCVCGATEPHTPMYTTSAP